MAFHIMYKKKSLIAFSLWSMFFGDVTQESRIKLPAVGVGCGVINMQKSHLSLHKWSEAGNAIKVPQGSHYTQIYRFMLMQSQARQRVCLDLTHAIQAKEKRFIGYNHWASTWCDVNALWHLIMLSSVSSASNKTVSTAGASPEC